MNSKYFCPILTSFNDDSTINYDDMHSLYDHVLENGIDGILVGGSAGEFYALDYNEAEQLISDAVQYINHRGIVIAGTGRMNRLETINLSNFALKKGADAVIIVGPYYSACSQEDVFNYFDDILGHISGNVYLYNYQDRTGYDISVNTVLRLLEKHKNLIGIKDTHPVSRHSQKYINEILPIYPNFAVYTGYDTNCVPVVISGGAGCIGALSNVYPKLCHDLVVALNEGNFNKIVEIQRKIDTYALFYEAYTPFNPLMKWALREMGYSIKENCRVPISKLTDSVKSDLDMVAKRLWRK